MFHVIIHMLVETGSLNEITFTTNDVVMTYIVNVVSTCDHFLMLVCFCELNKGYCQI